METSPLANDDSENPDKGEDYQIMCSPTNQTRPGYAQGADKRRPGRGRLLPDHPKRPDQERAAELNQQ